MYLARSRCMVWDFVFFDCVNCRYADIDNSVWVWLFVAFVIVVRYGHFSINVGVFSPLGVHVLSTASIISVNSVNVMCKAYSTCIQSSSITAQ